MPKVRFAPSPTGYLHVGNTRIALANALFARSQGGNFLLRIDDTDTERSRPEFEAAIEQDLTWLGLGWDEKFRQSDRTVAYADAAEILKASGRLYPCFESEEELRFKRDMRLNFFDSHFASFNRQVMLVDVLSALYGGRAAFEDTARAIAELGAALRYGANTAARGVAAGMIRGMGQVLPGAFGRTTDAAARSLATRRIERVTFVATKADHVPAIQRDNLRNLVRALAHAKGNDPAAGAPVTYQTAAAIRSRTRRPSIHPRALRRSGARSIPVSG